jgi:hypothetical protein
MAQLTYVEVPTRFQRTGEDRRTARLVADLAGAGAPVPARIFGNLLEHPGFAIYGGVRAQVLSNPGFERDANLSRRSLHQLNRRLSRGLPSLTGTRSAPRLITICL